jgi:hypothetical protein
MSLAATPLDAAAATERPSILLLRCRDDSSIGQSAPVD